jgi:hypothetical protein
VTLEDPVNLERCRWLTLACLMLSTAHADDMNKHSATLSVQGDSNDNRQWLGRFAMPLGEAAWAQASLGKSEFAAAGANNATIVGAALGTAGTNISAAVEFVQRKGGAGFEQQSWAATLDWHGMRGGLGADLSARSAEGESTSTQTTGGVFGAPVTTTVRESVHGTGFGVHGHFVLTSRFIVSAGVMRYQYDFDVSSTSTANNTALASLLGVQTAVPGAWRDQAFVDRTYRVGGTYLLQGVSVGAQYFRDRVAKTDETFSTMQLQVELPIAEQWSLSPTLGYSQGGSIGNVAYGGMNVRYSW